MQENGSGKAAAISPVDVARPAGDVSIQAEAQKQSGEGSGAMAQPTSSWLSSFELVDRLCLRSSEVVAEIYRLAQRQIEVEDKREGLLTTKAGALLGQTGVSITISIAVAGVMSQPGGWLSALPHWWWFLIVPLYLASVGSGLMATLTALSVLWVRDDYEGLNEAAVFDTKELQAADQCIMAAEPGQPRAGEAAALARYRRYLAVHMWGLQRKAFGIHEEKAKGLLRGQKFFAGFVVGIAVLGASLLTALLTH